MVCAARVLAVDMNVTRVRSLTDSLARTSRERFASAGYEPTFWAESYALRPSSATDALALMLTDTDVCAQLVGAAFTHVGAGSAGDVLVLSLASP